MKDPNYLSPNHQLILNELKSSGEYFESRDKRLLKLPALSGRAEKSIAWYLWDLHRKGYINRVRRGRRVYFSFRAKVGSDERQPVSSVSGNNVLDGSLKYTVAYTKDEDGYIVASVPTLPGCHSQGRTKEEARKNIREAMKGYLASMKHHGEPIPKEDVEIVQVTL